jgi:hypothetical protein
MEKFAPNLERIHRDIVSLSKFISPKETGYTRISFPEEDREARRHVAQLMESEYRIQFCWGYLERSARSKENFIEKEEAHEDKDERKAFCQFAGLLTGGDRDHLRDGV